jgi:hypothetical protein
LSGEPVLGAVIAIAGLIASYNAVSKGNTVQGGATNNVVNLSSNAAVAAAGINALTAVSSDPLPLFSFAAAIAKRNEEVKAREKAEQAKKDNNVNNTTSSYGAARPSSPTYETGTNNTVSSTSAQTPGGDKSYSSSTGTANQSASETISRQGTAAGYAPASPTGGSTNPAP